MSTYLNLCLESSLVSFYSARKNPENDRRRIVEFIDEMKHQTKMQQQHEKRRSKIRRKLNVQRVYRCWG